MSTMTYNDFEAAAAECADEALYQLGLELENYCDPDLMKWELTGDGDQLIPIEFLMEEFTKQLTAAIAEHQKLNADN